MASWSISIWAAVLPIALYVGYCRKCVKGVWRATAVMVTVFAVIVAVHVVAQGLFSSVTVVPTERTAVVVRSEHTDGLIVYANGDVLADTAQVLRDNGIHRLDWVLWLNEPSGRSVDVSPFSVPIDRLLITASEEAFASLPAAREITVFEPNGILTFGKSGTLTENSGWYRLSIKDSTFLIASADADANTLPHEWRDAELVFTENPAVSEKPPQTVVFCKQYEIAAWQQEYPEVLYSSQMSGKPLYINAKGDIHLQDSRNYGIL